MNMDFLQSTTQKLWFWLMVCHCAGASSIGGTVHYLDGKLANGFIVLIVPASNEPIRSVRTTVESSGRYIASGFPIGDYAVYAYDDTPAYPLRNDMFLSKSPYRTSVDGVANVTVDIVLPPPAATIRGTVTLNGNVVVKTEVSLCHFDETWRSATIKTDEMGRFTYYVPSNEELSITVLRPQLKPSTLVKLVLTPGESRDLTIKVEEHLGTSPELACKPFR